MSWVCPICSSNNDNENLKCAVCDCERPYEGPKFDIQSQIKNSARALFTKEKVDTKVEKTDSITKKKSVEPELLIFKGLVIKDGIAMQYRGTSKNVVFPDIPLKGINSYLFQDADIETIIVPNDVQKIYSNAFCGCKNLKWILFLGKVDSVEKDAFNDDHNNYPFLFFHQEKMPDSWGCDWYDCQFNQIWNVANLYNDSYGNTYILYNDKTAALFSYNQASTTCELKENIKDNYKLTEIFRRAFYENENIVSVSLPSTIKKIGREAFARCNALNEINIPEGTIHIETMAFSFCYSLKEIVIPSTVTFIGASAFVFANSKLKIYIKSSSRKIPKSWDKNWDIKDIGIFNIYKRYPYHWV